VVGALGSHALEKFDVTHVAGHAACLPAGSVRERLSAVRIGCYYFGMPVRKLSVALEEPVADAAKQAAKRRGMSLSAWLNEASVSALETEFRLEDGLAGVAEWEAEHGPPSAEEMAEASAILDAAGVGRKREPRHVA
jgi:hypothetical protein